MKKTKTSKPRLALDRETVKTLVELRTDRLQEVAGGTGDPSGSSVGTQTLKALN